MKINPSDYIPLKLGLIYLPATIVIKYGSPINPKEFIHRMKVGNLKQST